MGWTAAILFLLGAVTDWLDGGLARKWDVQTNMGRLMDPIADKVLVSSALIILIEVGRTNAILVLLLLVRDILIGGIRSVAATEGLVIDAKAAGKWKTGFQMGAIPLLFIDFRPLSDSPDINEKIYQIANGILWFSVILSLISGAQYIRLYYKAKAGSKS
jgi:CDP-diacylglycerol--glycerol-3-phosphate 3-phosphatidyltransferase